VTFEGGASFRVPVFFAAEEDQTLPRHPSTVRSGQRTQRSDTESEFCTGSPFRCTA
jgi:hypothetical protein